VLDTFAAAKASCRGAFGLELISTAFNAGNFKSMRGTQCDSEHVLR
jgi:hypothetical protein